MLWPSQNIWTLKKFTRILHVSNVSSVSVPNIVSYSLGAAVRKKYMILSTSCSPISTLLLAKVQMSIILLNNDITYVHRVLSFQGPLKRYGRNTFPSFILWNYNLGGKTWVLPQDPLGGFLDHELILESSHKISIEGSSYILSLLRFDQWAARVLPLLILVSFNNFSQRLTSEFAKSWPSTFEI